MATKGEMSSSTVHKREFLLEIEAKVKKWWENEKVFSAKCKKPGDTFFGKFPFDVFMGNPVSLSKLDQSANLPAFPVDVMRFALAYACDGAVDEAKINFLLSIADSVFATATTAILQLTEEISWHEEFLAADFNSCLRCGPPSTFADRVFANEINIALNRTKQQYEAGQFRGALDSIFELQDARNWYKTSCGDTNKMNRDLVWRFMDVQTCLLTPICPHYAEYIWRDFLYKIDFVVNADWPVADAPDDSILQNANKYLKCFISSMERRIESERNKKGSATPSLTEENEKFKALIYVSEACDTLIFAPHELHTNYRQNENLFKQNVEVVYGVQASDLNMAFREKVLLENLDFIKRKMDLDKVRVLSATNPHDPAKAGSLVEMSDAESSSPGNLASLSFTRRLMELAGGTTTFAFKVKDGVVHGVESRISFDRIILHDNGIKHSDIASNICWLFAGKMYIGDDIKEDVKGEIKSKEKELGAPTTTSFASKVVKRHFKQYKGDKTVKASVVIVGWEKTKGYEIHLVSLDNGIVQRTRDNDIVAEGSGGEFVERSIKAIDYMNLSSDEGTHVGLRALFDITYVEKGCGGTFHVYHVNESGCKEVFTYEPLDAHVWFYDTCIFNERTLIVLSPVTNLPIHLEDVQPYCKHLQVAHKVAEIEGFYVHRFLFSSAGTATVTYKLAEKNEPKDHIIPHNLPVADTFHTVILFRKDLAIQYPIYVALCSLDLLQHLADLARSYLAAEARTGKKTTDKKCELIGNFS